MLQFLGMFGSLIAKWMDNKAEKSKAKHDKEMELIQQSGNWDEIQAQNSGTSWKDEWFTILLSIPLIGAFYPPALPAVQAGFAALNAMPEFYQYMLFLAVGASFGYRGIMDYLKSKK